MRTQLLVTTAACAAALCLAPAALADQVTASSGAVSATLEYSGSADAGTATFGQLTVSRNGQNLFAAVPAPGQCRKTTCAPTVGFDGIPPLRVGDLDGDGEPEVLVTAFTGGAHCCIVAGVLQLNAAGNGYVETDRDFGNGGYSLKDFGGDSRPEFESTDDAFAYRFAPYAFSGRPVVVSRFNHGKFVDVTRQFSVLVRKDARFYWKSYMQLRRRNDGTQRGQIAPWAADEYRLGKRAYARKILRREAARGYLGSPARSRKFIKSLDAFLIRAGY